jgi:hypothetical protein
MDLKGNLANRLASLSTPLAEAIRVSQELMAPQLNAGTKGYLAKPEREAVRTPRRVPHY